MQFKGDVKQRLLMDIFYRQIEIDGNRDLNKGMSLWF